MVLHDQSLHFVNDLVISGVVEGLLERASLSTDVRPFLNRLYHSLIFVMPMALSPRKPAVSSEWFSLAYRKASGKI
jgi:hypothetical protein